MMSSVGIDPCRTTHTPEVISVSIELEEGLELTLDFLKLRKLATDVVPVVLQDIDSREVLFVGYANSEALQATLAEGIAVLWSTSRDELWRKGATSGDFLDVVDVMVNCEQNSLLYRVRLLGAGACHTRDPDGTPRRTCYYRRVVGENLEPSVI